MLKDRTGSMGTEDREQVHATFEDHGFHVAKDVFRQKHSSGRKDAHMPDSHCHLQKADEID